MKFKELGLSDNILEILEHESFFDATPIQEQSIPTVLEGRDLLGVAQTGSGKTAAYVLPITEKQEKNIEKKIVKTLVLCPTRELAVQIKSVFNKFAHKLHPCVIVGGMPEGRQMSEMRRGCEVIVATPGRLNDLVSRNKIDLSFVDTVVLDEADTMLDMGFINDIKKILGHVKKHQTLMFSATMPEAIFKLSKEFMIDPVRVEVTPTAADEHNIDQSVYFVQSESKKDFLLKLLLNSNIDQTIVFTRTKRNADKLGKFLTANKINAEIIHGDKRQSCRLRCLRDFKAKKVRVLIATDIAARGIDIIDLPYVIQYDMPEQDEIYIHRIGRTGRAGKTGCAISLCTKEELYKLNDIERLIKHPIPVLKDDDYSIELKKISERGSSGNHNYSSRKSNAGRDNRQNRKRTFGNSEKRSSDRKRTFGNDEKKFSDKKRTFGNDEKKFSDRKRTFNREGNDNNRKFNDKNSSNYSKSNGFKKSVNHDPKKFESKFTNENKKSSNSFNSTKRKRNDNKRGYNGHNKRSKI